MESAWDVWGHPLSNIERYEEEVKTIVLEDGITQAILKHCPIIPDTLIVEEKGSRLTLVDDSKYKPSGIEGVGVLYGSGDGYINYTTGYMAITTPTKGTLTVSYVASKDGKPTDLKYLDALLGDQQGAKTYMDGKWTDWSDIDDEAKRDLIKAETDRLDEIWENNLGKMVPKLSDNIDYSSTVLRPYTAPSSFGDYEESKYTPAPRQSKAKKKKKKVSQSFITKERQISFEDEV